MTIKEVMSETKTMSLEESYPPVFRQRNTATIELDEKPKDPEPLPLIDLQCLDLDKLGEACKDWGLFRLVNHGVPLTLLTQLQDHARKLFALSFESKKALFTSPMSYFWGTPILTPSGAALTKGPHDQNNINWLEGLNVPLNQLSQAHDPMLDSFRLLLEEYGRHLGRIATTIFEGIAKNLNLDLDLHHFKSYLSASTGFIRIYRYPHCSTANELWGMEVHTDSSVLSILNEDQVGGLEILKDDKWLLVEPIPNTLIINLGDMMQAISNDEYKSVKHRVKVNKYQERLSICYFVFPGEGVVIQSSKYKPFTYGDFQAQVQQDTKTLGYKVGLDRFRI